MDKKEQPGIIVKKIRLLNTEFSISDSYYYSPEKPAPQLQFKHEKKLNEKKDHGFLTFGVKLFTGDLDNPELDIVVEYIGEFQYVNSDKVNLELEDFLNHNAPAIIYPFVRSKIADLTASAGINTIMLPILNLPAIMNDLMKKEITDGASKISQE
ncbi:MAG: protein-export chaperone SecB [Bacteroidales bacterium]|nr:protein-export chaperone SecB [Bacteroidales bacterium]